MTIRDVAYDLLYKPRQINYLILYLLTGNKDLYTHFYVFKIWTLFVYFYPFHF